MEEKINQILKNQQSILSAICRLPINSNLSETIGHNIIETIELLNSEEEQSLAEKTEFAFSKEDSE